MEGVCEAPLLLQPSRLLVPMPSALTDVTEEAMEGGMRCDASPQDGLPCPPRDVGSDDIDSGDAQQDSSPAPNAGMKPRHAGSAGSTRGPGSNNSGHTSQAQRKHARGDRHGGGTRPHTKKGVWSEEEEMVLAMHHREVGNKWAAISKFLPLRSDNDVKNHWNSTLRSKSQAKHTTFLWLYAKEVEQVAERDDERAKCFERASKMHESLRETSAPPMDSPTAQAPQSETAHHPAARRCASVAGSSGSGSTMAVVPLPRIGAGAGGMTGASGSGGETGCQGEFGWRRRRNSPEQTNETDDSQCPSAEHLNAHTVFDPSARAADLTPAPSSAPSPTTAKAPAMVNRLDTRRQGAVGEAHLGTGPSVQCDELDGGDGEGVVLISLPAPADPCDDSGLHSMLSRGVATPGLLSPAGETGGLRGYEPAHGAFGAPPSPPRHQAPATWGQMPTGPPVAWGAPQNAAAAPPSFSAIEGTTLEAAMSMDFQDTPYDNMPVNTFLLRMRSNASLDNLLSLAAGLPNPSPAPGFGGTLAGTAMDPCLVAPHSGHMLEPDAHRMSPSGQSMVPEAAWHPGAMSHSVGQQQVSGLSTGSGGAAAVTPHTSCATGPLGRMSSTPMCGQQSDAGGLGYFMPIAATTTPDMLQRASSVATGARAGAAQQQQQCLDRAASAASSAWTATAVGAGQAWAAAALPTTAEVVAPRERSHARSFEVMAFERDLGGIGIAPTADSDPSGGQHGAGIRPRLSLPSSLAGYGHAAPHDSSDMPWEPAAPLQPMLPGMPAPALVAPHHHPHPHHGVKRSIDEAMHPATMAATASLGMNGGSWRAQTNRNPWRAGPSADVGGVPGMDAHGLSARDLEMLHDMQQPARSNPALQREEAARLLLSTEGWAHQQFVGAGKNGVVAPPPPPLPSAHTSMPASQAQQPSASAPGASNAPRVIIHKLPTSSKWNTAVAASQGWPTGASRKPHTHHAARGSRPSGTAQTTGRRSSHSAVHD